MVYSSLLVCNCLCRVCRCWLFWSAQYSLLYSSQRRLIILWSLGNYGQGWNILHEAEIEAGSSFLVEIFVDCERGTIRDAADSFVSKVGKSPRASHCHSCIVATIERQSQDSRHQREDYTRLKYWSHRSIVISIRSHRSQHSIRDLYAQQCRELTRHVCVITLRCVDITPLTFPRDVFLHLRLPSSSPFFVNVLIFIKGLKLCLSLLRLLHYCRLSTISESITTVMESLW